MKDKKRAKHKKLKKQKTIQWKHKDFRLKITILLSLLFIGTLSYIGFVFNARTVEKEIADTNVELFESKVMSLRQEIFSDDRLGQVVPKPLYDDLDVGYILFFSISDTNNKAKVITSRGALLESAWVNGVKEAIDYIYESGVEPLWVKVDIVDSFEVIGISEFPENVSQFRSYFYRKGISFDPSFNLAFLEAELNSNKMIDYEQNILDIENINQYLEYFNRQAIYYLPDDLVLFTTLGWFCDHDGIVYPLYGYKGEGYDYGRRIIDLSKDVIEDIISTSTEWLIGEVQDDGEFIYGYFPIFDRRMTHYNVLRHAVSIQPLIWYYSMTGREDIVPVIESTIEYLVEDNIEYKDINTAFVIDRPNNEIKLGGNGLAIITLKEYMDTFSTDKYEDICIALGNGILELMNEDTGTFYHVLNKDFTKKEEFRTVFYDGEATYALAILHEVTGDEKWLNAAKASVENFIREDYTQYRDHWVAYAMNEITKHSDDQRYYEFALRNVQENLDAIYYRDTSYHTYLELLMASFELYHRMVEEDVQVDYYIEFDSNYFFNTIIRRAEHMLNGYLYPEFSMYLNSPGNYSGTFIVRHHDFRIRIDDVEHFIAGYYNLWRNFDQIIYYKNKYSSQ